MILLQPIGCQGENGQQVHGGLRQAKAGEEAAPMPRTARWVEQTRDRDKLTPVARGVIYPDQGHAGLTNFRFDASLSTDDIDRSRQLSKRWDFDGDGSWDTEFTKRSRLYYTFPDSGLFSPKLLVRDNSGRVDSCSFSALRINNPCPAPDFTMVDINPYSSTFEQSFTLSEQMGNRVLLWYVLPSK